MSIFMVRQFLAIALVVTATACVASPQKVTMVQTYDAWKAQSAECALSPDDIVANRLLSYTEFHHSPGIAKSGAALVRSGCLEAAERAYEDYIQRGVGPFDEYTKAALKLEFGSILAKRAKLTDAALLLESIEPLPLTTDHGWNQYVAGHRWFYLHDITKLDAVIAELKQSEGLDNSVRTTTLEVMRNCWIKAADNEEPYNEEPYNEEPYNEEPYRTAECVK